jgi:plasmid stabilization system protein ParE
VTDILWSPRAEADLKEMRERLREFPDSGRMVPERQSPELREIVSGNFRIVCRRTAALVEIATVFRGSRDFSSLGL